MLADNGDPYSPRSNSDSASPVLAGKLASAETELAQLRAVEATVTEPKAEVSKLLADLPKVALRAVDQLEKTLASGDVAARQDRDQGARGRRRGRGRRSRDQGVQQASATLLRAVGAHSSIDGSGGSIRHLLARLSRRLTR
jgi:hypothetical protein